MIVARLQRALDFRLTTDGFTNGYIVYRRWRYEAWGNKKSFQSLTKADLLKL